MKLLVSSVLWWLWPKTVALISLANEKMELAPGKSFKLRCSVAIPSILSMFQVIEMAPDLCSDASSEASKTPKIQGNTRTQSANEHVVY